MKKAKSTRPFFSIIIPTLNEERFLPSLLKSLQEQEYHHFEVIVVDGQSKDQTLSKVKFFQKQMKRLKVIQAGKANVCRQRNLGAKKAQAPYLIFLDADTTLNQKTLQKIHHYVSQQQPALFFPQIRLTPPKISYQIMSLAANLIFLFASWCRRNIGTGCFLGIKSQVFQSIAGFDEKLVLSEEHNLIKKARQKGYQLSFIKNTLVNVSARRIEKEGIIKFLFKYLYFIIYEHLKGPIYRLPLNYPMGGQYYD